MLLEEIANIGAGFIDGVIASNCLGSAAMASEGIVHPFSIVGAFSGMLAIGTPKLVKRACNTAEPVLINAMAIAWGGQFAMSAMAVSNNLRNMLDAFGAGLASTVIILTCLFVGEKNKDALIHLQKSQVRKILAWIVVVAAVVILFPGSVCTRNCLCMAVWNFIWSEWHMDRVPYSICLYDFSHWSASVCRGTETIVLTET